MTTITADEIRRELDDSYRDARETFLHPHTEDDGPESFTLWKALVGEALYAIDRYRPNELTGLPPDRQRILTDETDESIDELADRIATEAMPAVMELAHSIMAKRVAAELGGRTYRVPA